MGRQSSLQRFLIGLTVAGCGLPALADVGPPIKIRLVKESAQPAVPGEKCVGTFEVLISADGIIDSVKIEGDGWRDLEVNAADSIRVRAGDMLRFDFTGTPGRLDQHLRVKLSLNDWPVQKTFDLSPERFARVGKPDRAASLDDAGRLVPFRPRSLDGRNTARGQTIRFHGQLAYQRPTSPSDSTLIIVGADSMYFEIKDDDSPDPFDDTIYSGYTDLDGYFNVTVNWDDCDILGCDKPDIYLRWETDNSIVSVQTSDLFETDYSWSTESNAINDFTGSEIDFGTLMPGNPGQHPAMHIHNSIVRAHRFILLRDGTNVEHLDVQWPEDEIGSGAYYTESHEEIHISPSRQWNEDTHTHEFGHHFLYNYSATVPPDYANGICDTDVPGHCRWCPETDHDAWNEGWPNWLADVVTRSYPLDYGGYEPYSTRDLEGIETTCSCCLPGYPCCAQNGMPNDPFQTEGYAGALLRDMEDAMQDDHDGTTDSFDCRITSAPLDCDMDSLALGVEEIFMVVKTDRPTTIRGFIDAFRSRFPQYDQDLLGTLRNTAPEFAASFILSPPIVESQTQACKSFMEGDLMLLDVQGNGSMLQYRWRQDGVNLIDSNDTHGASCPFLVVSPVIPDDAGVYDARVRTCNGTLSVMSAPIRVQVFPRRGVGNLSYAWGRDDYGQLGLGIAHPLVAPNVPPAEIPDFTDAVAISSGNMHTLALKSDGTVVAWGSNESGQLGIGSFGGFRASPVAVLNLTNIVAIAAGQYHSMALQADGTVWTWGYGAYSALGDGTDNSRSSPINVPDLSCITAIVAGWTSSFAMKSDGTVWAWGFSSNGELGPQASIGSGPGARRRTPVQVTGIDDATAIAVGANHCLVIRADGTMFAWGRNIEGELGNGGSADSNIPSTVAGVSNVVSIGAGTFHSIAIVADGTAWGWGSRYGGQLCDGSGLDRRTPLPVNGLPSLRAVDGGDYHSIFLHDGGGVTTCGWNNHGQVGPMPLIVAPGPYPLPGISGTVGVVAGAWSSFALPNGVAPVIRRHPASLTVQAGRRAAFSVEVRGLQPLTYQWQHGLDFLVDGGSVYGATTPTLTLDPVRLSDAGSYSVTVTNGTGLASSLVASLTVNCAPADVNCDGKLDLDDFVDFQDCLSPPGAPPNPALPGQTPQSCLDAFDRDGNGGVDLADFALFQIQFGGE